MLLNPLPLTQINKTLVCFTAKPAWYWGGKDSEWNQGAEGLDLTEAAPEHGLRCVAAWRHPSLSNYWQLAWVAGVQGPGCQTWQGEVMKFISAASEPAERGFSRSDKEEPCLLELGNSKSLSAWDITWAPRATPADHHVPAWNMLGAVTCENDVSQWKLVMLCRGLTHWRLWCSQIK